MDAETRTAPERRQEAAAPSTYKDAPPIKVNKLGYLLHKVSDIERAVKFWTGVMGFIETDDNEHGMVILHCNADHHAIGLKPGKAPRHQDRNAGIRIEHLAMEVADTDMLFKARQFFRDNDTPIVFEGRKGAGCNSSISSLDPDGYEFEIYCDMDQIDEGGRLRPASQFNRANSLDEAIANPVPKRW